MHRPILPASLFKVLALALVIVVTALAQARADTYPGPALVFNAETGEVLAAERAFDPWYPASTTKLMTIFLAFEAVRSGALTFDAPVTVSQNAASEPPSRSGLRVGTQLRLQAALEMLMVKSANDIAVAVAEAVGGSEAAFVRMMNEAAARLGMTSSRFVNPHGLPDDRQVTTAHDLGLLARRLWLDFPEWRGFFSITSVTLGNHHWRNHNLLITRYPGAIGFKTGFICASGFNLVAGAQRDGTTLIAVVLGARSGLERAAVAKHLLDTGFRRDGSMFGGNGPSIVDYRPSRSPRAEPENMRPRVCRQPRERPSAEDLIAAYGQAVPTTTYVAGFAGNARDEIFANVEAGEEEDGGANAVLDQVIGAVVRADSPRALVTGGTVGAAAAPRGLYAPPNPEPRPGSFAAAAATPASVTAPAPATTPAPASVPAAPRRAVPQPGIRPSILGE